MTGKTSANFSDAFSVWEGVSTRVFPVKCLQLPVLLDWFWRTTRFPYVWRQVFQSVRECVVRLYCLSNHLFWIACRGVLALCWLNFLFHWMRSHRQVASISSRNNRQSRESSTVSWAVSECNSASGWSSLWKSINNCGSVWVSGSDVYLETRNARLPHKTITSLRSVSLVPAIASNCLQ